jgi:hypothetical protein
MTPSLTLPPTLKAFIQIIKLEGNQNALPVSNALLGASLAAYAVLAGVLHGLEHTTVGAAGYGALSMLLLAALTAIVLTSYGKKDQIVQTLTAAAAAGAFLALLSILLHFVFAVALPPPLPTDRLVRFLLFPISILFLFMLAWLYRHASMRTIPAFALAATYVVTVNWIFGSLLK